MTVLLQNPAETLNYSYNWSERLGGATIVSSSWSITPSAGVTLNNESHTTVTSTVFVSGLTRGQVYHLINQIIPSTGTTELKSITIRSEG